MSNLIVIRAFLDLDSAQEAEVRAGVITRLLTPYGVAEIVYSRKYKKIPEYYEVLIELRSQTHPKTAFTTVMDCLGEGWSIQSDTEAIWNHGNGQAIFDELRWIGIEFIEVD